MRWCWLGIHTWTDWSKPKRWIMQDIFGNRGIAELQTRVCTLCGIVDEREV